MHRLLQKFRRDAFEHEGEALVCRDEMPMAIDGKCRKGLMPGQDEIDDLARCGEFGILLLSLLKSRRETGGEKKRIALAQRHVELLGQMQQHFAAWPGAAGFDETQMAR